MPFDDNEKFTKEVVQFVFDLIDEQDRTFVGGRLPDPSGVLRAKEALQYGKTLAQRMGGSLSVARGGLTDPNLDFSIRVPRFEIGTESYAEFVEMLQRCCLAGFTPMADGSITAEFKVPDVWKLHAQEDCI